MRSLVIGGAGFVGGHLVDALVAKGPVTVLDDLSTGLLGSLDEHARSGRVTFVRGDVRILSDVDVVMAGHDVVFHLAANSESQAGVDDTRLDLEIGTIATHNVLEATRRRGVKKFVLASSSMVYGPGDGARGERDIGDLPGSLHGASKLACESLVAAFARTFGIDSIILRFGSVVGPRDPDRSLHEMLARLAERRDELVIPGAPEQTRSFLHVDDCVAGILFVLERARGPLDVFNLSSRGQTTLETVARQMIARSPYADARVRYEPAAPSRWNARPRARLDVSKLAALGFSPSADSDAAVARVIGDACRDVFGG